MKADDTLNGNTVHNVRRCTSHCRSDSRGTVSRISCEFEHSAHASYIPALLSSTINLPCAASANASLMLAAGSRASTTCRTTSAFCTTWRSVDGPGKTDMQGICSLTTSLLSLLLDMGTDLNDVIPSKPCPSFSSTFMPSGVELLPRSLSSLPAAAARFSSFRRCFSAATCGKVIRMPDGAQIGA